MKQITFLSTLLLFVFIQFAPGQIPKTMSYQGVLTDASGAPVPDGNYLLHFRFYQSPTGGSPIWMENQTVAVTDGIFNVTLGSLNPLTLPFNTAYWLGVTVSPPGPELTPRTPLTAAPYSLSPGGGGGGWSDDGTVVRLTTVTDSVGIGTADPTEKLEVSGNLKLLDTLFFGISDDAMIYRDGELVIQTDDMPIRIHNDPAMYIDYGVYVNSSVEMAGFKMPTGAANQYVLTSDALGQGTWQPAAAAGNAWSLSGNSGAAPPSNFLGTTDLQPFEIKVNNSRVFRFEPGSENTPNLIGGSSINNVASGIKGATIGGGGGQDAWNEVSADFGTIGGGKDNRVTGEFGTVGGGTDVRANGDYAAVGGGFDNAADGRAAAIAGGESNVAEGSHSAVGGGYSNSAQGDYATVPGGHSNTALGKYSFAAGNYARADHDGCFVWADSAQEGFASSAPNQFLIRASGSVGIGTASPNPESRLHVHQDGEQYTGYFTSDYLGEESEIIHAEYTGPSGTDDIIAVYGRSKPQDNWGLGGFFVGGWKGIEARVLPTGNGEYYGVEAWASGGSGNNYGVKGYASGSGTNYGVYGYVGGTGTNWAGYFAGNAHVTGTLSKGGGSFKIDHPLDPANKYLYHSFVESPEMLNVYNGNVILDASGEAWVELPEWFEALNMDFRYQLTSIGAPGPNLYIAEEISGNRFKIAGGAPGVKVSWQVTGVRQDAFAQKNRIPVEELKSPEDRGKYLHPEAHGLPESLGIDYTRQETMQKKQK
ncbi:MAG: hypothetical protein HUU32_07095 [Calditrichaceae bacterium]|nr:hypothetical protein [Calditrichia bacterium]NUQ41145.1 hypothetical protein [Calditrichaceae bacterium]